MHPTIVLTGASDGIGAAAAIELARGGAVVVPVGRSTEKLRDVAGQIKAAGGPAPDPHAADFASLAEVRGLAATLLERHERIDVLVNNAALAVAERTLTVDGFETTFAVNHLAPFLLTNLLLPRLEQSTPSRVVTTGSVAAKRGRIDLDDLQSASGYARMQAYANSKLCNALFTIELARRLDGSGVTANCLHPGNVQSNLFRGDDLLGRLFRSRVSRLTLTTPDKAAHTIVHLAAGADVAGQTGLYWVRNRPAPWPPGARDPDAARRLWEVSAAMVGLSAADP